MKMLTDLLSSDDGIMSLAVILIVIAIWIYFAVLLMGKIGKSSPHAGSRVASQPHKP